MTTTDYVQGVLGRNRRMLAKTITLLESQNTEHQVLAEQVLAQLLPYSGQAVRIGLSGVPGVGKSTFIEAFGMYLLEQGKRLAVLAVDPSSERTGGSIMGDKTRMERLAADPRAFIRPSPSGGTLGGVAKRTREAMLACEASGFDVIVVETVGVGQSEVAVANMTDIFVLLMLPSAGDELQGIKRGIMELADMVLINKADLHPKEANRAEADYRSALRLLTPHGAAWTPEVLQVSALASRGLDRVWHSIEQYLNTVDIQHKRNQQNSAWFETLLRDAVWQEFLQRHGANYQEQQSRVKEGLITPTRAVHELL